MSLHPQRVGQASWRNMGRLKVGDVLVHYAKKEIRSIGQVMKDPEIQRRPSADLDVKESHKPSGFEDRGYVVEVQYYDLRALIGRDEIEEEWRVAEMGPFDKRHMLKMQGGAYPLDARFVEMLRDEFRDRFAPGTPFVS